MSAGLSISFSTRRPRNNLYNYITFLRRVSWLAWASSDSFNHCASPLVCDCVRDRDSDVGRPDDRIAFPFRDDKSIDNTTSVSKVIANSPHRAVCIAEA